jgi:hypothetical protein
MDVTDYLRVSLGSSTVQLHDSLGSRRACACSEASFDSMTTVLEKCNTEEQLSVVCFCGQKNSMQKDIHKKMFSVYGGKCLSCKAVHNWVEKFSQRRSKAADDETEVRKWLRRQSKDFYAVGFDALLNRWDRWR